MKIRLINIELSIDIFNKTLIDLYRLINIVIVYIIIHCVLTVKCCGEVQKIG